MRRILLLTLAVILTTLALPAQGKKYQVFGVAFYNLENLFDTINNNGSYDLEFSPQGSRNWTGNEQIRSMNYRIIHHDSPDRRGIDVGFIYNPRLFSVLNVTHHLLYLPDNPDFRTRDQTCVTGLLGGEKVSIIVGHWPSRTGGEASSRHLRIAAAKLAKHIADSVLSVDPNQGVIIMGDLNDDPFNESCAEIIGAVKDQKDVKDGGWYNPWWSVLDKGIGSLAYRGQWNLFDQILVNSNLVGKNRDTLKYLKCKVHNDIPGMKTESGDRQGYPLRTFSSGIYLNGFSDHFPTQIFLVREVKMPKK